MSSLASGLDRRRTLHEARARPCLCCNPPPPHIQCTQRVLFRFFSPELQKKNTPDFGEPQLLNVHHAVSSQYSIRCSLCFVVLQSRMRNDLKKSFLQRGHTKSAIMHHKPLHAYSTTDSFTIEPSFIGIPCPRASRQLQFQPMPSTQTSFGRNPFILILCFDLVVAQL
jgi:hypothetical protein